MSILLVNDESAYRKLLDLYKDATVLSTAQGILHWDMETMMPPKAVEQRGEQLALMSRLQHKLNTDPQIPTLLNTVQSSPQVQSLGQIEKRNLYLISKNYKEQTALPEKLVGELAMQQAITVNAWKKAKAKKDFTLYKADLKKLFELSSQAATMLMEVKETKTPYEALIDNFEPRMSAEKISQTFNKLLAGLKPLIDKIEAYQIKPANQNKLSLVPVEAQKVIAQLITQTLGYDTTSTMACGRVDETEHPFTSGCYDDVRITTNYHLNNFNSSIFSVLHETGHAIYEHNINHNWKYQPVGTPCSYGIHESQSRFYENVIGRSREFWMDFLPKVKIAAPMLSELELNNFIQTVNKVERSKIRIEADEVTYSIHIIIRFELERDLFAGKIDIEELPFVWNQKYYEYLGMEVKNDSEGVMQDTHWASGLYGYFPSYALGNIYDGQIVEALSRALPGWNNQVAQGNLEKVNSWLNENIHKRGNLYDPEELIEIVTGNRLNGNSFIKYLNDKYSKIYGF